MRWPAFLRVAVRLALGAGRRHLILQSLVESLVLALLGGGLGLLFAAWANAGLLKLIPAGEGQLALSTAPDLRILGFTLVICLGTALGFGLLPAAGTTRIRLLPALRNAATSGAGASRGRNAVAGLQVFLTVLLLMAAGLFVRTLEKLRRLDPGFETATIISFSVDPSVNGYRHQRAVGFFQALLAEVRSVPGVEAAAMGTIRLLNDDGWGNGIAVDGYTHAPDESNVQSFNVISTASAPATLSPWSVLPVSSLLSLPPPASRPSAAPSASAPWWYCGRTSLGSGPCGT